MDLVRFRHKGPRQLYVDDSAKGVPPAVADKLRKILLALETAESLDQVSLFPGWRLHALRGSLEGYWSLTVTANWRLVFRYDSANHSVSDIDLVDYH